MNSMNGKMKAGLYAAFSLLLSACTSNLYLVRHTERLDNTPASPLSAQGLARAEALRDTLLKEQIDLIYCSVYERTQQTAAPLARALRKTPTLYSPDTARGLLPALRKMKHRNVLVVGHSDNIPWLIRELTGYSGQIAHGQYGDLFQVLLPLKRLIRRHF
ncbi:MAG: phosphoglycerate mutase family protein [Saprospiraceae bacterium]